MQAMAIWPSECMGVAELKLATLRFLKLHFGNRIKRLYRDNAAFVEGVVIVRLPTSGLRLMAGDRIAHLGDSHARVTPLLGNRTLKVPVGPWRSMRGIR